MDSVQDNVLAAMRQAQAFVVSAPTPAIAEVNAGGAMTTFNAAVAALTALGITQKQSIQEAQGETSKQQALRTALLQVMTQVATIAKVNLTTVPEFSSLKMPRSGIHSAQLITAANAMANAATPYTATFTAGGCVPTFIANLQAAATALQASIDGRKTLKATAVGATAGTTKAVTAVKDALKALDSFVEPALAGDPTLLAQWKNAKKISKKLGVPTGTTKSTPVVPAPTPVTPVAATPAASETQDHHPSTQEAA